MMHEPDRPTSASAPSSAADGANKDPVWSWLTPSAPAAVALLRCSAVPALFRDRLPEVGAARLTHLLDLAGSVIDEVVVTRLSPDWLEVGVHGGPGVRAAVAAALSSHGLHAASPVVDLWQRVAQAPSPAAVAWLLATEHPEIAESAASTDRQKAVAQPQPPFNPVWLERCPQVLLTGPVNAGKSTLLNAWCGHQRALATPVPGTTRDLVTAETEHRGWRLRLIDSAGIRHSEDDIERAGIQLAQAARAWADVVIRLVPIPTVVDQASALLGCDELIDGSTPAAADNTAGVDDVVVVSKSDLGIPPGIPSGTEAAGPGANRVLHWAAPAFVGEQAAAGLLAAIGDAVLERLDLPPAVERVARG